jgi:light-harvesting protein B-800-850 alpha chain
VVHPTVGLPLFLASVALTSLAVHTAVMTHTTWMSSYWAGSTRTKVSMETTPPSVAVTGAPAAFSMKITPVPATDATPASFVVTVTPNAATTMASDATPDHPAEALPIRTASTELTR